MQRQVDFAVNRIKAHDSEEVTVTSYTVIVKANERN